MSKQKKRFRVELQLEEQLAAIAKKDAEISELRSRLEAMVRQRDLYDLESRRNGEYARNLEDRLRRGEADNGVSTDPATKHDFLTADAIPNKDFPTEDDLHRKLLWRNSPDRFCPPDKIFPLTIVADRYGGVYSGGEFTAWNVDASDLYDLYEVDSDDHSYFDGLPKGTYGKGSTPEAAWSDLFAQLVELGHLITPGSRNLWIRRHLTDWKSMPGDLPKTIVDEACSIGSWNNSGESHPYRIKDLATYCEANAWWRHACDPVAASGPTGEHCWRIAVEYYIEGRVIIINYLLSDVSKGIGESCPISFTVVSPCYWFVHLPIVETNEEKRDGKGI